MSFPHQSLERPACTQSGMDRGLHPDNPSPQKDPSHSSFTHYVEERMPALLAGTALKKQGIESISPVVLALPPVSMDPAAAAALSLSEQS